MTRLEAPAPGRGIRHCLGAVGVVVGAGQRLGNQAG